MLFRVGLTVYLAFATVAGPLLCCCTTARLAAGLLPTFGAFASSRSPTNSCCQHGRAVRDGRPSTAAGSEAPTGESPCRSPGDRPCPCRNEAGGMASVSAANPSDNAASLLRPFACVWEVATFADAPDAVGRAADGLPPQLRSLPFLTTQELLRAHHVLRC